MSLNGNLYNELNAMRVDELRDAAKRLNISGRHRMNKNDLVQNVGAGMVKVGCTSTRNFLAEGVDVRMPATGGYDEVVAVREVQLSPRARGVATSTKPERGALRGSGIGALGGAAGGALGGALIGGPIGAVLGGAIGAIGGAGAGAIGGAITDKSGLVNGRGGVYVGQARNASNGMRRSGDYSNAMRRRSGDFTSMNISPAEIERLVMEVTGGSMYGGMRKSGDYRSEWQRLISIMTQRYGINAAEAAKLLDPYYRGQTESYAAQSSGYSDYANRERRRSGDFSRNNGTYY